MTLSEKIKNEPYLKVSNCTDAADLDFAISTCKKLLAEHGSKKVLCSILARLEKKRNKIR